jgi:hypothetical protein
MTYKQLALLSTTFGAEFGRALSYCVQDCMVTKALDEKLSLSETRLGLVEKCNVPLSGALHWTTA